MIPKELNASLKHFYVFYHSKAFSVSQDPFYYSFFNLRFLLHRIAESFREETAR